MASDRGSDCADRFSYLGTELEHLRTYAFGVHDLGRQFDDKPPPKVVFRESANELMSVLFSTRSWPDARLASRMKVLERYFPFLSPQIQRLLGSFQDASSRPLGALAVMCEALLRRVSIADLRREFPRGAAKEALKLVAEFRAGQRRSEK